MSVYPEANIILIERCKNGDGRALHELYELYARAMFNVSLRILNSREEAEEVLQDAFLKVFNKMDAYDQRSAFGAWLKKIVVNASLDKLKKRKVVFVSLDHTQFVQEEPAEEAPVFEVESIKESMAALP